MDHEIDPEADLLQKISGDVFHHVIHTVRDAIAPLSNSPEDIARRDRDAISRIACLLPANADEANIAGLYVAASAHAMTSLARATRHADDDELANKFYARADRLMRQARGFRALLLRVQAARKERESDNTELDRARWHEHCIAGLMARSLGLLKPSVAPEPEPEPEAQPDPVVVALRNRREYDDMDPAEKYATIYPRRAALIRSLGRLPDKCDFGPPDDDLVEAIVASTSPILRELDKPVAH